MVGYLLNFGTLEVGSVRGSPVLILHTTTFQLLILSAPKFVEWLMQQGLILQEMWDPALPPAGRKQHNRLKLALHSDGKKYANSGGYVWIDEKNNNK